jgi:hypothetical protein
MGTSTCSKTRGRAVHVLATNHFKRSLSSSLISLALPMTQERAEEQEEKSIP